MLKEHTAENISSVARPFPIAGQDACDTGPQRPQDDRHIQDTLMVGDKEQRHGVRRQVFKTGGIHSTRIRNRGKHKPRSRKQAGTAGSPHWWATATPGSLSLSRWKRASHDQVCILGQDFALENAASSIGVPLACSSSTMSSTRSSEESPRSWSSRKSSPARTPDRRCAMICSVACGAVVVVDPARWRSLQFSGAGARSSFSGHKAPERIC